MKRAKQEPDGRSGDLILANGNGAPSAKTIALTAMPGTISATINHAHELIAGAKTGLVVSQTTSNAFASRSHYGTSVIPFLRSDSSDSPTARGTMART